MRVSCGIVVGLLVISGCASSPAEYRVLAASPTPSAWTTGSSWVFYTAGNNKERLGSVTLSLTDETVETCVSGSWYRAEVVENSSTIFPLEVWYSESDLFPAYTIEGRFIEIIMNAGICDNYATLRGEVFESGAQGAVGWEHLLGGKELGEFVAERVGQ